MINLNADQQNMANSLLFDLCIRTRRVANTRAGGYTSTRIGYSLLGSMYEKISASAATTIMDTITRRTFNFTEVDKALEALKTYHFAFGATPKSDTCSWSIKTVAGAAKFLAWICEQNRIYWYDLAYTPAEREAWKTSSVFAHYLFQGECFASQPTRKSRASRATASSGSSTPTGTGATGTAKSTYKSAGPQSAFVAGLVGKPGDKFPIRTGYLYCIVGDKAGTITPKAFIHPVENPAVGERAKVNAAGLPVVKFGAGNGYTDLAIYSTDPAVMENILAELRKNEKTLSKYSGVKVTRIVPDRCNYFKVNTEYGEVLVKTKKLNEKIFEEVIAGADEPPEESPEPAITEAITDMDQFVHDSKMYD